MNGLIKERSAKIDAWFYEHGFGRIRTDTLEGKRGILEWWTSKGQMLILHREEDGRWEVYTSLDDSGRIDPTLEALNFWVHK